MIVTRLRRESELTKLVEVDELARGLVQANVDVVQQRRDQAVEVLDQREAGADGGELLVLERLEAREQLGRGIEHDRIEAGGRDTQLGAQRLHQQHQRLVHLQRPALRSCLV